MSEPVERFNPSVPLHPEQAGSIRCSATRDRKLSYRFFWGVALIPPSLDFRGQTVVKLDKW